MMPRYPNQRKFLLWLLLLVGASATVLPILSGLAWAGVEGIARNGTTVWPQPDRAALRTQESGERNTASAAAEESAPAVRRVPNAVSQAQWYILGFTFFILGVALVHLYRIDQTRRGGPQAKPRPRRNPR